jgi:hypothetical protein
MTTMDTAAKDGVFLDNVRSTMETASGNVKKDFGDAKSQSDLSLLNSVSDSMSNARTNAKTNKDQIVSSTIRTNATDHRRYETYCAGNS